MNVCIAFCSLLATTVQGLRLITKADSPIDDIKVRINFLTVLPNEVGKAPIGIVRQVSLNENGDMISTEYDPVEMHDNNWESRLTPKWSHTVPPVHVKGNFEAPKSSHNDMGDHLLKDLDHETITKLRACQFTPSVMIHGEPDSARNLSAICGDRTLILANGYDENNLEVQNIGGTRTRNLWIPFASTFFIEAPHLTPIDLIDRTHAVQRLAKKKHDHRVIYMQTDCAVDFRQKFYDAICETMARKNQTCHFTGCKGFKGLGEAYQVPPRTSEAWEEFSVQSYEQFKFAVSMENRINNYGYVTEKMVLPLLAGTVPIYRGAKQITDIFDPDAFLLVKEGGETTTINKVLQLLDDEDAYKQMVSRPTISEEKFRKYFTWHSSTWARYGDGLRRRIIENLLEICNEPN